MAGGRPGKPAGRGPRHDGKGRGAGERTGGDKTGPDDGALWRRIAEGVKPLDSRKGRIGPAPQSRRPADAAEPPRASSPAAPQPPSPPPARAPSPLPPLFRGDPRPGLPPPRARAHGDAPDVDRRTATRLRRGLLPVEATIDLHGMTRDRARTALTGFLQAQAANGCRCVLVVTGKGLGPDWSPGVIRSAVPDWLNAPPLDHLVLAFAHARPDHGGSGALYVLLRRNR